MRGQRDAYRWVQAMPHSRAAEAALATAREARAAAENVIRQEMGLPLLPGGCEHQPSQPPEAGSTSNHP